MDRQGLAADDHTAYYVVNLLTLFSRSEVLFEQTENGTELRPLAAVLAEAVDSREPAARDYALQRIGDVSLFVAGFLGDGMASKLVDLDYYVQMGGTAYGTLSETIKASRRRRAFSAVFAELAGKFQDFVDVLADVASSEQPNDADVLRTYEVWLRTGSERAARLLRSMGIEPNQGLDTEAKH